MADVFISYAKSQHELAMGLARRLEEAGLSVWWDAGLRPGENYRIEIDEQLNACKAAVIIWTPDSIRSDWVIAEADHAWQLKKLVNTHVAEVKPYQIPKPFNQAHSVEISSHDAILGALRKLFNVTERQAETQSKAAGMYPRQADRRLLAPSRRVLVYGLSGLMASALIALIALYSINVAQFGTGTTAPVPKWTFSGNLFIGRPIPFAWKYDRDAAGQYNDRSILFELSSAKDDSFADSRTETYADGDHKSMSHINSIRWWRVRAVENSRTRKPISEWSAAVQITQYDSAYGRIRLTREVLVSVSNAEVQGPFKWLDAKAYRGFDIMLAKRIEGELARRLGIPLELVQKPVEWGKLLDQPRQGGADFIISSITRLEQRQRDFEIEFSDTYYCSTHALMYRVGMPNLPIRDMIRGKSVGVQEKSTNAILAEELLKGNEFQLVTFANTEAMTEALLKRKIDYAVADPLFAIAARFASLSGSDQLAFKEFKKGDFPPTLPVELQMQNYAIAVRAGERDLLNTINSVIETAKKDGSLTGLLIEATREFEDFHGVEHGAHGSYAPSDRPWECAQ